MNDTQKTERKTAWRALDRKVIAVAIEGFAGDWSAYIGAVPGENHEEEWRDVLDHGSKLSKALAELLFPSFKHLFYRE